eukprot:COSAG02_NODE_3343_length_6898_cov_9.593617_1_plen_95_part_00
MQEFPSPCDAPSNQKKLTELTEDRKTNANFKSSARVAAVRTRAARGARAAARSAGGARTRAPATQITDYSLLQVQLVIPAHLRYSPKSGFYNDS